MSGDNLIPRKARPNAKGQVAASSEFVEALAELVRALAKQVDLLEGRVRSLEDRSPAAGRK